MMLCVCGGVVAPPLVVDDPVDIAELGLETDAAGVGGLDGCVAAVTPAAVVAGAAACPPPACV